MIMNIKKYSRSRGEPIKCGSPSHNMFCVGVTRRRRCVPLFLPGFGYAELKVAHNSMLSEPAGQWGRQIIEAEGVCDVDVRQYVSTEIHTFAPVKFFVYNNP